MAVPFFKAQEVNWISEDDDQRPLAYPDSSRPTAVQYGNDAHEDRSFKTS
ncbi:hypothetical protein UVI_02062460 [Ustilaginoidea virens]|uniref:Uncharacterized protein n=1 Tax=Ustilaginoidea virens TaxID=1159556 RepID=A0A1B5L6N4_USTVR|nr:hypothetical protein UVI_02062460 [Ustilaginoidea virens]